MTDKKHDPANWETFEAAMAIRNAAEEYSTDDGQTVYLIVNGDRIVRGWFDCCLQNEFTDDAEQLAYSQDQLDDGQLRMSE